VCKKGFHLFNFVRSVQRKENILVWEELLFKGAFKVVTILMIGGT